MYEIKLKKCPFCGSANLNLDCEGSGINSEGYVCLYIVCLKCRCQGPSTIIDRDDLMKRLKDYKIIDDIDDEDGLDKLRMLIPSWLIENHRLEVTRLWNFRSKKLNKKTLDKISDLVNRQYV